MIADDATTNSSHAGGHRKKSGASMLSGVLIAAPLTGHEQDDGGFDEGRNSRRASCLCRRLIIYLVLHTACTLFVWAIGQEKGSTSATL